MLPTIFLGLFGIATADINAPLPYPISDLQIYEQAKIANGDFDVDEQLSANIATGSPEKLNARNKSPPPLCNQNIGNPWTPTDVLYINNGITYLRGKGSCGVNPRSCARISCSYQAAIFLCNDRNDFIAPSCAYLASYAQDIVNRCQFFSSFKKWQVAGQEFDTDNYNVVVRAAAC
ncbi:hypothetical protein GLAREA_04203 [Glarea lozoyensis ATCC 20868]|uniref:Secreted protein n=1 Tax=Glarea lozoyensis (strain ATCC 20868 / MF5171) TaxID=1116229 RepID=S3CLP8_GLAL2|nr:uncharacterized protein GLAREA_04203 [Glarea lozoyensis ATCC 20868]EPE27412.1 hypothetical protein GLAREA_04203 [Glarea lozoyensis ATCC 20868]